MFEPRYDDPPMPRHEVAIYVPESGEWYERTGGRGGGAERQMMLLARALSTRGCPVAHIVFEPHDPVALPPNLTLVRREEDAGDRSLIGGLREAVRIWRALSAADARVTIVRAATPAVGIAALHCKLHRRRLIYSSGSTLDFLPADTDGSLSRKLYSLGVRLADVLVVQSQDQAELARQRYSGRRWIVHIPSFCEPADELPDVEIERGSLLWVGRVRGEKAPQRFVDLARAVPDGRFTMIPVELEAAREHRELQEAARAVPNLTLCERLPHPQLMQMISHAVAVVNTSPVEGMPNVFLEAWARGVPVLSLEYDPDGVIARRRLGIAAAGSWDLFVAGARELLDGRVSRTDLSRRAHAYIEEVHSIDAVATRWAEVIERLEQRRSSR
jgi:glycosyltransferase involved in cell wall biosynthesis